MKVSVVAPQPFLTPRGTPLSVYYRTMVMAEQGARIEANVLVSPRLHGTNTPLKIYKQMASGKPLVATRIWSHTQVLNESECILVEPGSDSLAHGLLQAINDPDGARQVAARARMLYERQYARPVYEQKIRRLLEIVS